jgi:hypothetical protein
VDLPSGDRLREAVDIGLSLTNPTVRNTRVHRRSGGRRVHAIRRSHSRRISHPTGSGMWCSAASGHPTALDRPSSRDRMSA